MAAKQSNVITIHEFDPEAAVFSDVKPRNNSLGKVVYISYGPNKEKLWLQLPMWVLTFGISTFTDKDTGRVSHNIDLTFRDADSNADIRAVKEKMSALDEIVIHKGLENCTTWLGSKLSESTVREMSYTPIVKPSKNQKYAPTYRIKIPMNGAKFFDEERRPIEMADVPKGCRARLVVEAREIWISNKNFGVAFNLLRLQIMRRTETIEDFPFRDVPGEEVVPFSGNPLKRKAKPEDDEDEEHEVVEEDIEDF